ncbi:elongator complex protein 5 [Copidosoma floridanum]|uniref:elongator complex protein 5 n=1 Tax=Copidosoma floridanum TaxID=29053 RepID=UPI0006C98428|nr:elongator complex protein 5 [Copidosoma floridanum]
MAQLLNLPVNNGNSFIVVDEGIDATYAENLTIAWLQALRKKNIQEKVSMFLFSTPKCQLEKSLKASGLESVNILDYFSVDLQKEDDKCQQRNIDLYENLMNNALDYADSVIVINCLSTLSLQVGPSKACKFVEKLNQTHKTTVFCIYRRDLAQSIPRIETLGNIYAKLRKAKKLAYESNINYEVSVTHRKAGGSIVRWNELVQQSMGDYSLVSERIPDAGVISMPEVLKPKETAPKPQSSFRIEMSEQEMKQRDSVPLPYILPGNPGGESKIIYVPDEADDLDEEDPDDDLDI